MLTQIGLKFEVIPSTVEEVITSANPVEVVQELAQQKARDVAEVAGREMAKDSLLVIGADTIVVYEGKILGKPEDKKKMLFGCLPCFREKNRQCLYRGGAFVRGAGNCFCRGDSSADVSHDAGGDFVVCKYGRTYGQGRSLRDSGVVCPVYPTDSGGL